MGIDIISLLREYYLFWEKKIYFAHPFKWYKSKQKEH